MKIYIADMALSSNYSEGISEYSCRIIVLMSIQHMNQGSLRIALISFNVLVHGGVVCFGLGLSG